MTTFITIVVCVVTGLVGIIAYAWWLDRADLRDIRRNGMDD